MAVLLSLAGQTLCADPSVVEEFSPQTAEHRYQKHRAAGVPGAVIVDLGNNEKRIDAQVWLCGYSTSAAVVTARNAIEAKILNGLRGTLVINNGARNESYANCVLESVFPIGSRDPLHDSQAAIQWHLRLGLKFLKLN